MRVIEKKYLCPLASVLWLLQPEFLKVTIEKREKTKKRQKYFLNVDAFLRHNIKMPF
jgi:hypothetical protein